MVVVVLELPHHYECSCLVRDTITFSFRTDGDFSSQTTVI